MITTQTVRVSDDSNFRAVYQFSNGYSLVVTSSRTIRDAARFDATIFVTGTENVVASCANLSFAEVGVKEQEVANMLRADVQFYVGLDAAEVSAIAALADEAKSTYGNITASHSYLQLFDGIMAKITQAIDAVNANSRPAKN